LLISGRADAAERPLAILMAVMASILQRVGKDGDMSDELIEATFETVLTREEAADRLHRLADQLARHNQVEFVRDGLRFSVRVPDEVTLKLELEVGDESEIEIELKW
jgi:amphi-Trp domain-containing protein